MRTVCADLVVTAGLLCGLPGCTLGLHLAPGGSGSRSREPVFDHLVTLTVENQSTSSICSVHMDGDQRNMASRGAIEPGASRVLDHWSFRPGPHTFYVKSCKSEQLVRDAKFQFVAGPARLILHEASVSPPSARGMQVFAAVVSHPEPAGLVPRRGASDPALEARMLAFLTHSSRKETYQIIILRTAAWVTLRHAVSGVVVGRVHTVAAGARWPDGHCTFQEFEIAQDFDGEQFTSPLGMHGVGDQWGVPCATLDAALHGTGAPPADSSSP